MRGAWALALTAACSFPTKKLASGDDAGGDDAADGSGSASSHKLYVIGGGLGNWGENDPPNATIPDVITATINADGSLGAWQTLPSLPQAYVHTNPAVVVGHSAYVLGEFGTTSSGPQPPVLLADLTGDQTWGTTTQLVAAQGGYQQCYGAATDGTYVVLANASGTLVWQSKAVATGGLGAWTTAPNLPQSLTSTAAVFSDGNVYVLGDKSGMLAIYYASLGASGVGSWTAGVTTSSVGYVVKAAVWKSHVYVAGGFDTNNAAMITVSMSALTSGTPGAFSVQAPLPQGRGNACVIAGDNAVYVIGGEPGSGQSAAYDTVYYALPDTDGAIGQWKEATKLPTARSGVSCVIL